jgi:hypothetical protein
METDVKGSDELYPHLSLGTEEKPVFKYFLFQLNVRFPQLCLAESLSQRSPRRGSEAACLLGLCSNPAKCMDVSLL